MESSWAKAAMTVMVVLTIALSYLVIRLYSDDRAIRIRSFAARPVAQHDDGTPIFVSEFSYALPVGLLGKKLGAQTIIEGSQTEKIVMGFPFEVQRVDDRELDTPVLIPVRRNDFVLKKGVHYKFEGYETGRFGSSPYWASPGLQFPYQFFSEFIITQVLEETPIATETVEEIN